MPYAATRAPQPVSPQARAVDRLTILGTIVTVENMVNILDKTISTVSELRTQWQDADLEIFTFETQLIALRTALVKIKEWMDTDLDESHHQLVIDLDRCMTCCQWLIAKIDVERLQFHMTSDDRLNLASKLKQLFKTKGIQDVRKMIEQQVKALTLLLTAYNM